MTTKIEDIILKSIESLSVKIDELKDRVSAELTGIKLTVQELQGEIKQRTTDTDLNLKIEEHINKYHKGLKMDKETGVLVLKIAGLLTTGAGAAYAALISGGL